MYIFKATYDLCFSTVTLQSTTKYKYDNKRLKIDQNWNTTTIVFVFVY